MGSKCSGYSFHVFTLILLLVLATLSACGGGGGGSTTTPPPPPPPTPSATLSSITITPGTANLALGLSQQFAAKGSFSDGSSKDVTSAVTWSSSAPNVATVSTGGLASSKAQGTATISASSGSIAGNATITIGAAQMTGVAISPSAIFVSRGSVQAFTATGTFTDGSTQDVTSSMTWEVKNHFVADGTIQSATRSLRILFDTSGPAPNSFTATTQRDGFTNIAVTDGHVSATAKLTVVSPSRFALITNNLAGPSVSAYTVDSNSGDLRMRGYKETRVLSESNPPLTSCITTDPGYGYAYVSNPGSGSSGNVRIYSVDSTNGTITERSGSPFSTSAPLNCIQFEPSGKFGYALGNWNGVNKLVGYSRDSSTGLLTELPWSPMPVGADPIGLAIDPLGQYLYFVTMEVNTGKPTAINGYSIDVGTGALTPIVGMPIFVSNTVTSLAIVHPSANHVYVSHGGGKNLDVYSIDRTTGLLKVVPGSTITTDTNPSALVFSADGTFAYMSAAIGTTGGNSTGTITTFRVDDTTGKLAQIGNTPAGAVPQGLTLDTSGQFLYLNDNSNYLRVYKLQEDGTPKYVRSMQTRSGQLSIAMIPGDSPATYTPASIFVTTAGDSFITGYTVGSDGSLTLSNAVGTPSSPNSIALLPWGTHTLVSASAAPMGSNLGSYLVDPLTGVVTYMSFLGDAAVAGGTAIDPGERYAFQSDSSAGVLRTYGRWPELGLNFWSLVSYSPGDGSFFSTFPAGAGAGPMAMLPSGRFLYVGNQAENSITAFNFSGELIESTTHYTGPYSDGSPYSTSAKPIALAADPMGMYLFVACDDKSLNVYSIDSFSGGHLKKVESVSLPVAATALGIDPSGHFLYVGDSNGNVSPYSIDIATGSVSALTPSVIDSGVTAISIDSSGQFAYILCGPQTGAGGNNGAIHALKVNPDGIVTELPVGPWLANNPSAIAFTDAVQ